MNGTNIDTDNLMLNAKLSNKCTFYISSFVELNLEIHQVVA